MPASGDGVIMIPNCACGERMAVSRVPDAFVCLNCDALQAREVGDNPRPRLKTPQDHAFSSEMRRREQRWFPKQFGSKAANKEED